MDERQDSALIDKEEEVKILELLSRSLYTEALHELRGWPESLGKSWYQGTCYYYLQEYVKAEVVFRALSHIPGFPVEVPLRLALSLQCQNRLVEALSILLPEIAKVGHGERQSANKALALYGNICLEMGMASHFNEVVSRYDYLLDLPKVRYLSAIASLFSGNLRWLG